MRIRGAKTELEEAGLETDGMVESTAKLRSEIMALTGVDIMDGTNQFKSTYTIMEELAAKWQDLSDIQQATVTELIAGKRQGNIVSSLMNNFDIAEQALETSLNSAGSAMKEHEKWQQSLEAQILKLKAAWQGLSQSFLSSDFLKSALDAVIALVDGFTKLVDTIGALPALFTVFTGLKGLFSIPKIIGKTGGLSGIKSLKDILAALQLTFPTAAKGASKLTTALKGVVSSGGGAKGAISALFGVIGKHPVIAAATIAIGALTTAFLYEKKKAEELSEKVDEVTSSYKEQSTELAKLKGSYDSSNEDSMISKYERLSKGVNALGENVSLTSDEYSEYQSIVNTIAEQMPSLVTGYDAQGNAMLSCAGSADKLAEAYKNLVREQNNELLENGSDIFKDFSNDLKETSAYYQTSTVDDSGIATYQDHFDADHLDTIERLMNMSDTELEAAISKLSTHEVQQISKTLEQYGNERNVLGSGDAGWETTTEHILRVLQKDKADIKKVLDEASKDLNAYAENLGLVTDAYFSNAFLDDYSHMSERMQSIITQITSGFDTDFYADFLKEDNPYEALTGYLDNLLETFDNLSDVDTSKLESAFDLQTKFNGGDISYGEYIKNLKEVNKLIDSLDVDDDIKADLKLGLNTDGAIEEYEALVKRLTSKEIGLDDNTARSFLNSLSAEEFAVAMDIIPKLDAGTTVSEIRKLIDEKLADEFKFDIELQMAGLEAFNTALSEARSATGLTAESITALKGRYEDLEGFNAGALFETTANGVRVNNEELARLESQYENINKLNINKNLNTLAGKYKELTEKIKTCTDAQEKETLQVQADAYADKIQDLQILKSQYDGLTSAFAKWQNAQSSANDGDNYDSVYENLENIQELYKQGLVGTDDFKTFAQLMSYEDLSTASIDEHVSAYKKGSPVVKRYFTEGQKGCKNFLNDLNKINSEWAHVNENGDWEINIDVEEAAKELDLNVSTIYSILDKLKDYGFEINIDDSSLGDIKTEIEKTETKLKELGQTPHKVNLDASDVKTIDSEIESLKKHINEVNNNKSLSVEAKTAQLDDARAKLEALIQKKQEASQPAFMSLDTSQVKSSMVEALGYVQEYQNSLDNLNMLLELKEAGITIDDSEIDVAQQKLDECAKLIQGLDSEVKLAIGLKEDASIEDIKAAIKNGDIVIDTDTSTANVKIEKLAENVERIEDKDVTITVTVNGLNDVEKLNQQIDLATNIDGDIDKLSEYVESAKALSDLDDNIASYVTANVDGNVTSTPEYELNNLEVFADGAKALKGTGSFSSNVTADVEGNVVDLFEEQIDNLAVFAESAKDVSKIGNVESKVTADVDGNVTGLFEEQIDNLKTYAESAKDVYKIGNVESKVTAEVDGNVTGLFEEQIDNLKVFAESAKNIDGIGNVESKVTAEIDGNVTGLFEEQIDNLKVYTESAKEVESIGEDVKSKVTADIDGNVTGLFEEQIDNLAVFVENAKEVEDVGEVEAKVTANIDGDVIWHPEGMLNNLQEFAEGAEAIRNVGDVEASVTANINGDVIWHPEEMLNNLQEFSEGAKTLEGIGDIEASVTANIDGNVIWTPEGMINNLQEFAEGAEAVSDIEDVDVSVTANIDGDAIWHPEGMLNNLNEFAEGAKALSDIEDVDRSITANIDGDAVWHPEGILNNLKEFSEGARELANTQDVSRTISANIEGDVVWTPEGMLNNVKEFAAGARELAGTEDVSRTVSANVEGNVIWTPEGMINNIKEFTEGANVLKDVPDNISKTVEANIKGDVIWTPEGMINNVKTFAESAKTLEGVGSPSSTVTANIDGNVINTAESSINNIGVFADNARKLSGIGSPSSTATANVGGNIITDSTAITDLEHFASIVSGMTNQTVTVTVNANVDSANVNSAIDLLTKLNNSGVFKNYSATVQVGAKIATIDDTTVKNYKAPTKDGKVKYTVDSTAVDNWNAPTKDGTVNYSAEVEALTSAQKHKTGTITYKANIVGLGPAAGTAHASGSANASGSTGRAFARGDWGIKGSGVALGGELGQELVRF